LRERHLAQVVLLEHRLLALLSRGVEVGEALRVLSAALVLVHQVCRGLDLLAQIKSKSLNQSSLERQIWEQQVWVLSLEVLLY
jgi:hypothetical protein